MELPKVNSWLFEKIIALNGGRSTGAITNFARLVGRTRSNVAKWCRGQVLPSPEIQPKLAEILERSEEDVMEEFERLKKLLDELRDYNVKEMFNGVDLDMLKANAAEWNQSPMGFLKLLNKKFFLGEARFLPPERPPIAGQIDKNIPAPPGDAGQSSRDQSKEARASGSDRKL